MGKLVRPALVIALVTLDAVVWRLDYATRPKHAWRERVDGD